MALSAVPRDTDPAALDVQFARWAAMSIDERMALVEQLNADVERMAIAGILTLQPGLSDVEVRHELTRRRYGDELAGDVYRDRLG